MKKIVLALLAGLTLLLPVQSLAATFTFVDVDQGQWAYQAIETLNAKGIINGYPDRRFYPDRSVSRYEAAKMLVSSFNLPIANIRYSTLADMRKDDWAAPYVESILPYLPPRDTINKIFLGQTPATREEVAVAIAKLWRNNHQAQATTLAGHKPFADADLIKPENREYIDLATNADLIKGYPDGTFRPEGNITRSEMATLLVRAAGLGNQENLKPGTTSIADNTSVSKAGNKPVENYGSNTLRTIVSQVDQVTAIQGDESGQAWVMQSNEGSQKLTAYDFLGKITKQYELDKYLNILHPGYTEGITFQNFIVVNQGIYAAALEVAPNRKVKPLIIKIKDEKPEIIWESNEPVNPDVTLNIWVNEDKVYLAEAVPGVSGKIILINKGNLTSVFDLEKAGLEVPSRNLNVAADSRNVYFVSDNHFYRLDGDQPVRIKSFNKDYNLVSFNQNMEAYFVNSKGYFYRVNNKGEEVKIKQWGNLFFIDQDPAEMQINAVAVDSDFNILIYERQKIEKIYR